MSLQSEERGPVPELTRVAENEGEGAPAVVDLAVPSTSRAANLPSPKRQKVMDT